MFKMLMLLVVLLESCCSAALSSQQVQVHRLPRDTLVPDVTVTADGTVHQVYGTSGKDAYYQQSTDSGASFSTALKLNTIGKVTTTMGERGPKIAVGGDGTIHVVWMDDWYPGALTYVRAVHSTDGGKSFSAPIAASDSHGIDGSNVVVDGVGTVVVFWHDLSHNTTSGEQVPKPANSSEATWLYFVQSTDGGKTFSSSQRVHIDGGMPAAACSMCMTGAVADPRGKSISVIFRSALNNIRDHYELTASPPYSANQWQASRVNVDNFYQTTCPMNGPTITQTGTKRVAAFTTGGTVAGRGFDDYAYWTTSSAAGQWTEHVPTPEHERNERYPTAILGGSSNDLVLFLWQVGPMAVSGDAVVKYALYHQNGTAIRDPSAGTVVEVGTAFAGTKPTVWVAADGSFHVLTTALKREDN